MLGIDELRELLEEVKGMRADLKRLLGNLNEEVRKVNKNLEEIEEQNKIRFEQRHGTVRHHR